MGTVSGRIEKAMVAEALEELKDSISIQKNLFHKTSKKGWVGVPQYCPDCGKENKDTAKFCTGCSEKLDSSGTVLIDTPKILDNRYEIISTVKSGAMGRVYKAKDTRLNNIVAVKQMLSSFTNPQDAQYAETRFKEEAEMLSALKHNGLPKVIDYFTEKKASTGKVLHYIVMEFVEGKDLETVIHERGQKPFSVKETVDMLRQIIDILSYLHSQKPPIIYRDMNPRNVMIYRGKVFLVDFGIAKVLTPQQKGTAIGTAGYAAPEQYKGESDIQSDIYSLGAMMRYLLTGQDPEHSTTKLFTFQQIRTVNPSVPEYLESLVMSMVEVVPGKRPSDADAVRAMLEKGAQTPQQSAHGRAPAVPATSPSVTRLSHPAPSSPRLSTSIMIVAIVSALIIFCLSTVYYYASREFTGTPVSTSESPSKTTDVTITHSPHPPSKPRATKKPPSKPKETKTPLSPIPTYSLEKVKVNTKNGAEMILIPAGEFLMGSIEGVGNNDEHPQHNVYLDDYYISKYEVTNEQFAQFVRGTGYNAVSDWKTYAGAGKEKHPVVSVNWDDAMAYCQWAGVTLPTEAQWEKAARGTDGRTYPWGNSWEASRCNNNGSGTTAVGSHPDGASPYGVQDMAGNVWEWCSDWYGDTYYGNSPSRNPEGDSSGTSRVVRGGSWIIEHDYSFFRCAYRDFSKPDYRNFNNGFRFARTPR